MRQLHPVVKASRLVCLFVVIFTPLLTTARSDARTKENVRFEINLTKKFLLYALPHVKTGSVKTTMDNILSYLNQDLFIDDLTRTDLENLFESIYGKLKVLFTRLYDRSLRDTLEGSMYIINDIFFSQSYNSNEEKKVELFLETLKNMVEESRIYHRLASYRTDQRQRLMAIHNLYKKNSPELKSTLEFLVKSKTFVERMGLYNSAFQKKIEEEKIANSEKSMEEIESEILADRFDRILRKMIERGTHRRLGFDKLSRHEMFLAMRDLFEEKSTELTKELLILEELKVFKEIMSFKEMKLLEKMIKEMEHDTE
ncbi:hypothetical protein RRG08_009349 [Elysia crispata]|uniref:Uncharacterized protein n=1 Tax=Elysia crispata TaxID=231223 RepID=A0AAE0XW79_9GAST|nr:hypothetical protein RRG08_009349 [Elysia crispata]